MSRGALCISIDLELLWGVRHHLGDADVRDATRYERVVVERLVGLLRQYRIPTTWATVGRLLDDSPGFDGLRGSRANWFAPELVDLVLDGGVDHEVASHGYGHISFLSSSAEAVRDDLAAARAVHERLGLPWRSFVFPRNDVGHLELLAESGLEVFRSVDAGLLLTLQERAPRLRPVANVLTKAMAIRPPVVTPRRVGHGLVEVPSSLLFVARHGVRRLVTPTAMVRTMERGLAGAVREAGLFHLWLHPSNFYRRMDVQLGVFEALLRRAAELREHGDLDVVVMGELTA